MVHTTSEVTRTPDIYDLNPSIKLSVFILILLWRQQILIKTYLQPLPGVL
jgi:hypothetical protein